MNWEGDKQLVRGSHDGINLAIGEPVVLRNAMKQYYPRHYPPDLSYPDIKPSEELLAELEKLHPGKKIVIALGAKHALHAAVYALKQKDPKIDNMSMDVPYWPTYPTIASLHGLRFNKPKKFWDHSIKVITSPNNPDGKLSLRFLVKNFTQPVDIWDAAYAHRAYGWPSDLPVPAKISVWSAGKMLGAPGVRLGWLVTEDQFLADHASRYVEMTTSGVPTISQYHVAATLRNTHLIRDQIFEKVHSQHIDNANEIVWLAGRGSYCQKTVGMFQWIGVVSLEKFAKALKDSKVMMVNGTAFGGPPNFYRISTGQSNDIIKQAVQNFNEAYAGSF